MNENIKRVLIWVVLSILMMIFWISGLMIGNAIFPGSIIDSSASSDHAGALFLFLTCFLNTGVVLYFIYNSRCKGVKLAGILFLLTFGVQYFMSQIETLWFNDAVKFPVRGIISIVVSGAIQTFLFSIAATLITGRFKDQEEPKGGKIRILSLPVIKKILILSVIVWPVIYFTAGYFIAWQFSEVRMYYSGSYQMDSFFTMMKENFTSGLCFFQIFRGVLWILIVFPALTVVQGSMIKKGIITGLLISVLGASQLLLPNPYMPEQVRMAHLLEVSSSNFLWGFLIAWIMDKSQLKKSSSLIPD